MPLVNRVAVIDTESWSVVWNQMKSSLGDYTQAKRWVDVTSLADYRNWPDYAAERRAHTLGIAIDWLACGLDPKTSVFWRQSDVPEVCELTWLIGSLTPMGLLERAHSYKDKTAKGISPNFGLFAYPVLMAADILLYDTQRVPVGRDQRQHLEMTRDIAINLGRVLNAGDCLLVSAEAVVEDGREVRRQSEDTAFTPRSCI